MALMFNSLPILFVLLSSSWESLSDLFIQYGYWGMAVAAFLAGTFVPFSSEAVLGALLAATDMDPVLTVASATAGNVAGSMFNYFIGRLGDAERISHILRVKPEQLERAHRWVERWGGWMGLITFLPILGTAISITLGIMRANCLFVFSTTLAGKLIRYIIVAASIMALT